MVRHVDAIGKTDESLIAITMTGRIASAPSTSGLKGCRSALFYSIEHTGYPHNPLILL